MINIATSKPFRLVLYFDFSRTEMYRGDQKNIVCDMYVLWVDDDLKLVKPKLSSPTWTISSVLEYWRFSATETCQTAPGRGCTKTWPVRRRGRASGRVCVCPLPTSAIRSGVGGPGQRVPPVHQLWDRRGGHAAGGGRHVAPVPDGEAEARRVSPSPSPQDSQECKYFNYKLSSSFLDSLSLFQGALHI